MTYIVRKIVLALKGTQVMKCQVFKLDLLIFKVDEVILLLESFKFASKPNFVLLVLKKKRQ